MRDAMASRRIYELATVPADSAPYGAGHPVDGVPWHPYPDLQLETCRCDQAFQRRQGGLSSILASQRCVGTDSRARHRYPKFFDLAVDFDRCRSWNW
ncbi:MAG TPA: hypothetical protein VLI04_03225, partial [Nocardioidaceae bacterium]|nr:hypothetical protein [Nocardioidaceae bacterium]